MKTADRQAMATPPTRQSGRSTDCFTVKPPDYLTLHGWLTPGKVEDMADGFASRAEKLEALPIEGATPSELLKVEELRSKLLEALGLEAPPSGWRSQHFTRVRLRHYLEARHGNVDAALKLMLTCIPCLDNAIAKARVFENAPPEYREIATRYTPLGFYGRDRRGCSVCYYRVGLHDAAGVLRETSTEFYLSQDWYFALWYWSTLEVESIEAGVNHSGRLCVIDVSGISISRAIGLVGAFRKQKSQYPDGEQPTPDGASAIWMVNMPWFVDSFWSVCKNMLPPSERAKIRMFGKSDPGFLLALEERVAMDQVPPCFGGSSAEPWPYGDGGDVPKGAAAAIADELAAGERMAAGEKLGGLARGDGGGTTGTVGSDAHEIGMEIARKSAPKREEQVNPNRESTRLDSVVASDSKPALRSFGVLFGLLTLFFLPMGASEPSSFASWTRVPSPICPMGRVNGTADMMSQMVSSPCSVMAALDVKLVEA